MCFPKKQEAVTPAASPAPPLESAEVPEVGKTRQKETEAAFGSDAPTYRVSRKKAALNPDASIRM